MRNTIPENQGNTSKIVERESLITTFPMIKYESIFDFYSEEPISISVQREQEGEIVSYEQIIRVRKWGTNGQCLSWSIYSTERESMGDIVIRKVVWEMEQDKIFVKKNIREKKRELLTNWPSIICQTHYVCSAYSGDIARSVIELDNVIEEGILLEKNPIPNWEWRDLEVKRLYDWGQVHNTWSTHRKNQVVEDSVHSLLMAIENYLNKNDEEVEAIYLNYSIMPLEYKKSDSIKCI